MSKHIGVILYYSKPIPRRVLILRSLKEQGWKISVIAWDRTGNSSIPEQCVDLVDNWQWVRIPAPPFSTGPSVVIQSPRYYYHLLKAIPKIGKVDLWLLSHLMLLPMAPFLPGKKIYDASDPFAYQIAHHFGQLEDKVLPAINFVEGLVEGLLVSRLNGIATIDTRNGWLERFYKRWNSHVQVLWNVPSKIDDPTVEEVKFLNNKYLGRQVVAYTGELSIRRGLRVAIKAAALVKKKHPDVLFLFIGRMYDDPEAISRLITEEGVEANVCFLDQMPYNKMLVHLRSAQIGLALYQKNMANEWSASAHNGRKLFTYMQAGVPIIGPNFGEIGKTVEEAHCGLLVDTECIEDVANTITKLLEDPERLRLMSLNARQAFEECFNWEIEKRKFFSFVNQIMGK